MEEGLGDPILPQVHVGAGALVSPAWPPSPPLQVHWLQKFAGSLEQGAKSKASFQHVELCTGLAYLDGQLVSFTWLP